MAQRYCRPTAPDCLSSGPRFESTSAVSKIALAISFTSYFVCLSEETHKAVGLFDLVSMPGEVKDPTHGQMCNMSWTD